MTTVFLAKSGMVQYAPTPDALLASYGPKFTIKKGWLVHKSHQRRLGRVVEVEFTPADVDLRRADANPQAYANRNNVIVIYDDASGCWWTAPCTDRLSVHAALKAYRHSGGRVARYWMPVQHPLYFLHYEGDLPLILG